MQVLCFEMARARSLHREAVERERRRDLPIGCCKTRCGKADGGGDVQDFLISRVSQIRNTAPMMATTMVPSNPPA
jgi:hypothetical protein